MILYKTFSYKYCIRAQFLYFFLWKPRSTNLCEGTHHCADEPGGIRAGLTCGCCLNQARHFVHQRLQQLIELSHHLRATPLIKRDPTVLSYQPNLMKQMKIKSKRQITIHVEVVRSNINILYSRTSQTWLVRHKQGSRDKVQVYGVHLQWNVAYIYIKHNSFFKSIHYYQMIH